MNLHFIKTIRIVFILVLACLCCTPRHSSGKKQLIGYGAGFVHPGLLNNLEEMEFVRQMVLQNKDPWKAAYDRMLDGSLTSLRGFAVDTKLAGSLGWQPEAREYIAERRGSPDRLRDDMSAAYIHAWIWFIHKDTAHARKAVEILNSWGSTFRGFKHEDHNPLLAGFNIPAGLYAAEIMRHTWDGWKEDDIMTFEKMLVEAVWPAVRDGADRPEQKMQNIDENHPNGNWEASTMAVMTGIAIFTDDREKFNHALRYWYGPSPSTGNPRGRLRRYIWKDGQCQETCRDLVHTQVGMSALTHVAEMAWKQGIDLYGDLENRLLTGLEYHVPRLMEIRGYENPCEPLELKYTGRWCPIYEMAYNHYHNRMGLECRWLAEAIGNTRPEGFWRSYGLSTLTHAGLPALPKGYDPANPDPEPMEFTPNYDENKVPGYQLPDPLLMQNGKRVRSTGEWEDLRRPEIVRLFDDHVYGQVPSDYDSIRFISQAEGSLLDGKAIEKKVEIRVFRKYDSISINLLLIVPAKGPERKGTPESRPVFLLINHRGKKNPDLSPEQETGYFPASLLIENGYAISTFHIRDVAPDHPDSHHTETIRKLYPEQLLAGNGMCALGAWGWGASRIMDYLESEPLVDPERVVVMGHSRSGKAALWCGAKDIRFNIVISNESGCGGAALSRRRFGETLGWINWRFPHWFCENFSNYNEKEDELPLDQHMLISLMAPRPVYIGTAAEDRWADTKGQFLSGRYANPVYKLYGKSGLATENLPDPDSPVQDGFIGFHLRSGKHNLTRYDWEQYIRFSDKHFKRDNE